MCSRWQLLGQVSLGFRQRDCLARLANNVSSSRLRITLEEFGGIIMLISGCKFHESCMSFQVFLGQKANMESSLVVRRSKTT
mmetsp:Transcript_27152/g.43507  ORF Transcript_27152/g.43507 Transcript_27152/m.43507 type:complete len:82 (-) Transcript_27152:243-488(-)